MNKAESPFIAFLFFAAIMLVMPVAHAASGAAMRSPETSSLFRRHVDGGSGVVSYVLEPGRLAHNQQSVYFTAKSMTDDGRFLLFDVSDDEFAVKDGKRAKVKKNMAMIDFLTDTASVLEGVGWLIPFLDVREDKLYYIKRNPDRICRRDLLVDPFREIKVCDIPKEEILDGGRTIGYYATHITLTADRSRAFLDMRVDDRFVQGMLLLATGKFEKWSEVDHIIDHGAVNPVDDKLALGAWEVDWTDSKGKTHLIPKPTKENPGVVYPRLNLFRPGMAPEIVPAQISNYATHENWAEDGKGFYYCCGAGVVYHDLASGRQTVIAPMSAGHATMTGDNLYVVFDAPDYTRTDAWYRGCPWTVTFWNRRTSRWVRIHSGIPALCPKDNQSYLHPDPHPQFVMNGKYVVCTLNEPGRMNLSVTPTDQLVARTTPDPVRDAFGAWPKGCGPKEVGARIVKQFLSTDPEGYQAKGFAGHKYGEGGYVAYSVASLWVNALEYARLTDDPGLQGRLEQMLHPFYPGGAKQDKVAKPRHVDFSVFGAVPLEVAVLSGDERAREMGLRYADDQWEPPRPDDLDNYPAWLRSHYVPAEKQMEYLKNGYSGQTRLWIDDMYMINLLQSQAYRATGDRKYIDRAAKEMCLYLDRLQLGNGLFNHAADVPFRWGRGNGWMAAGMPMILQYMEPQDAHYGKILAGYRKMMETLLKLQRPDGLWGQLVDDPESWAETSGTAMFAYSFIMGVKHGWLDAARYAPAARKAYLAVCGRMDALGNVADVCCGTGAKNDRQYYLDRQKINGDPHGQAPMLWCVNLLLH